MAWPLPMNSPVPMAPPSPIMMSCRRLKSLCRPASRLAIAVASNRSLACGDIFEVICSLARERFTPMNRESFYADMDGGKKLDYEIYLNTADLLACQKPFDKFCNKDELQFQVVHQVEELWMKLIAYTLLDIDEYMEQQQAFRI